MIENTLIEIPNTAILQKNLTLWLPLQAMEREENT
jgi:hypothetical protein